MLATYPRSTDILEMLGEVCFRMGDWPEAGRYWFLTERTDKDAQLAFRAFRERYGKSSREMLRCLPIRMPLNMYGPIARDRAEALIEQCEKPQPWHREVTDRQEQHYPSGHRQAAPDSAVWRDRLVQGALIGVLVGPWMAGLFTLALWLLSLAFPSAGGILRNWLFP